MTAVNTPDVVTVQTAAAELGLSIRAVQHRITTGTLAAERFGEGRRAPYMIPRAELDRAKSVSTTP